MERVSSASTSFPDTHRQLGGRSRRGMVLVGGPVVREAQGRPVLCPIARSGKANGWESVAVRVTT